MSAEGDQGGGLLRAELGRAQLLGSCPRTSLAGGQLPSARFGANAAWWALMVLALNLNGAMKLLVLGQDWVPRRMKALRFGLIGLPGRMVCHARRLLIRLGASAATLGLLLAVRETIRALACGPGG